MPVPRASPTPPPSQNGRVVKAVLITAASTLVLAGILFLFFHKLSMAIKHRRGKFSSSFRRESVVKFRQQGGTPEGLIVDENGLEVLYLRRVEAGPHMRSFSKVWINPMEEKEKEEKGIDTRENKPMDSATIQEIDLAQVENAVPLVPQPMGTEVTEPQPPCRPPPPPPPQLPTPPLPLGSRKQTPRPPPPPPPLPPPCFPPKKVHTPPPLPPNSAKQNHATRPPPPGTTALVSSSEPPPGPSGKRSSNGSGETPTGEISKGFGDFQMKLKPVHWDKVIANDDHSTVWDEINDGSFRFEDDLLEALFGYTETDHKSPESSKFSTTTSSNPAPLTQIFILEPRKSQNTAIVLKSLAVSRKEVVDALIEGRGLSFDILERLSKISPTQEEASRIIQFNGNPTKLADAESFLYHILKAVPSAFIRFKSMLFRSSYDSEILHLKESLQALELGCKELRARGIFLRFLEAILKAGNRMNAGTTRGNAQGFNLTALRKLSYVKSTDGKTTLLQFVVEQVVRSEGKRCASNQNPSLVVRKENQSSNGAADDKCGSLTAGEEREREYLMLGLPVLGRLSADFSNLKKSAAIDYNNFFSTCSDLTVRVKEIRNLVISCGNDEGDGFVREMKRFLEECEEELNVVREEQARVMVIVRTTTEYYQAGGDSKDGGGNPLQLFVIVKDFLDMVDQVRLDIARKLQKRSAKTVVELSPPASPPPPRTPRRFQNFQSYFRSDNMEGTPLEDDF